MVIDFNEKLKDKRIFKRLEEHYTYMKQFYPEDQILGIFLYGSQNYGTDTENSDIDTKLILVPNLKEVCFSMPVSKEYHMENDEHCEVKDIREIIKNFRKQNINFIEILYTKYCIINPKYAELWKKLILIKENISHYDVTKCVHSISGQAEHTLKQNPEDNKKISNGLRLFFFLNNYLAGKKYQDCLVLPFEERQYLKQLKNNEVKYDKDINNLIDFFAKMKNESYPDIFPKDSIDEAMEYIVLQMIKLNF